MSRIRTRHYIAFKYKPHQGCFYDENKDELRSYPSAVDTEAEIIDLLEFKDKVETILKHCII